MISNPIADMLTRIRNANAKLHADVAMPHSNMKEAVAKILEQEGYILGYDVEAGNPGPTLRIRLKYRGERSRRERAIREIRVISKPSRRVYVGKDRIPKPLGGMGLCILSTSEGVLAGHEARERGIGGEVLCQVA
ncbi:MAG: 30S ribosomal protein S8 [Candidatus Bipolaricaulota bacterium]|nr:MAG: 30S ribosomal protein S8 [Candidatus Bipolaricaulota bacterium]